MNGPTSSCVIGEHGQLAIEMAQQTFKDTALLISLDFTFL
jgi:hypothetical protein